MLDLQTKGTPGIFLVHFCSPDFQFVILNDQLLQQNANKYAEYRLHGNMPFAGVNIK